MRYEIMRNKYINVVICLCRIFFKYVDNILLCKKNMLKRYLYYYNKLKEPYYPYNNIKKDMVMEKRLIKNICSDYFNYIKKKRNDLFHMSTGRYNFKNKPHDTNEPYIINISDLKNEKSEFGHIINLDNFYKNKKNENIFMSAPRKNRNNKKEEIGKKQKNTHKRNCKGIKYLYCRLKNNPDMIKIGRANKIKRPAKYKIKKKIKRIHCHNNFSEYLYKGIEGNIGQYKNEYFTTMNRTYLMKRKLKEHRVRIRKKYIEDIEPNVKKKKEPLYENVNENLCVHMNKNICVDMYKNICVDMNKNICVDMNKNICVDMNKNICGDMNKNICVDMNKNICGDMNKNICGDMNKNICVDMNKNICVDMSKNLCAHINNTNNHITNLGLIKKVGEDEKKGKGEFFTNITYAERCDVISRYKRILKIGYHKIIQLI
ncbi:hypothetical protein PFLG_02098 [Plasmodium falciparum RAJ116]|uniref:Uncharacterized protein n=1 Tax=Plasmodium falciparum RAJ116 TaxID=580058 RepID=A0A0L0CYC1_PLAFA|nr:hypothetical protein PFLG_02098 [Plasmodium falciparum RAJ116]